MQSNLRHVDTVTVKGSNVPVSKLKINLIIFKEFYTIDLDMLNLEKKIKLAEINTID
jgi:hypothetical protein